MLILVFVPVLDDAASPNCQFRTAALYVHKVVQEHAGSIIYLFVVIKS